MIRSRKNWLPTKEREKSRGREKREGSKSVVVRGVRCLFYSQPLNITLVHDIIHHGNSLIYHENDLSPSLIVSSKLGTI